MCWILACLFGVALAATQPPPKQFFMLHTEVLPGQPNASAFNDLVLTTSSTPQGGFASFLRQNSSLGQFLYLNKSEAVPSQGHEYYNIIAGQDVGEKSHFLDMQASLFTGADWQSVGLGALDGSSASINNTFYLNDTGLQWKSPANSAIMFLDFRGWLVCDWFYGFMQLFWLDSNIDNVVDFTLPSSCARVNLKAVFLPKPTSSS